LPNAIAWSSVTYTIPPTTLHEPCQPAFFNRLLSVGPPRWRRPGPCSCDRQVIPSHRIAGAAGTSMMNWSALVNLMCLGTVVASASITQGDPPRCTFEDLNPAGHGAGCSPNAILAWCGSYSVRHRTASDVSQADSPGSPGLPTQSCHINDGGYVSAPVETSAATQPALFCTQRSGQYDPRLISRGCSCRRNGLLPCNDQLGQRQREPDGGTPVGKESS
jgi:hypothetical protein